MSGSEPLVLRVEHDGPESTAVEAAVAALTAGQLVVLPTDTVYGVACRADDEVAVRRLFAAKRRPPDKPLPLLLPDQDALQGVWLEENAEARVLGGSFWPGPLTLVVRKSAAVSDLVTAGQPTVGVRVPDLPLTKAILSRCTFPVAATSANLSAEDPACAVNELSPDLLGHVAVVVDAGLCPGQRPSTVADVTIRPFVVLRTGPISEGQIAEALEQARPGRV